MNSTTNARSVALWIVIAVATVAIAWKLVARTAHDVLPVEPTAHAAAEERVPAALVAPLGNVIEERPAAETREEMAAARAVPIVRSDAPADASVHGFVRPVQGGDFAGDRVQVKWVDRSGQHSVTQAAADGAFSFAGMQPGRYWFRASSRSSGSARVELDVAGEREFDLQLELPSEVRVRVVDAQGIPLQLLGLLAVATREPPGTWIDEVFGSWNNPFGVGSWTAHYEPGVDLPSDVFGRIELRIQPPVHVSLVRYQYVVATQKVEPGVSEVTFVVDPASQSLQPGTLRFRAIDARTHEPLKKGAVSIDGVGTRFVSIDPTGPNEIELFPGWHVIHVRAAGCGDPSLRVRIEPGVVTDLGEIALEASLSIAGRVLDADGQPIALDILWDACGPDGRPRPRVGGVIAVGSKSDGTFTIPGLAAERYRLNVRGSKSDRDAQRWRGTVDARQGSVENLEIRLVRTTPLVVSFAPGSWENASLRIVDGAGEPRYDQPVDRPDPRKIALEPGSYVVEYRAKPDAEPRRIPVTIADEPLQLALP